MAYIEMKDGRAGHTNSIPFFLHNPLVNWSWELGGKRKQREM